MVKVTTIKKSKGIIRLQKNVADFADFDAFAKEYRSTSTVIEQGALIRTGQSNPLFAFLDGGVGIDTVDILGRSEIIAIRIEARDDERVIWGNTIETGVYRAFDTVNGIIDFIDQDGIE